VAIKIIDKTQLNPSSLQKVIISIEKTIQTVINKGFHGMANKRNLVALLWFLIHLIWFT